ncbi:MAG: NAD(P)H-hydrate dehydratase [Candidatus Omnitrophota bacterium]
MRWPARFFKRKKSAHKGDYGHVLVCAGSRRMTGAAFLCAQAAMRSGAGYVTLAVPDVLHKVFAAGVREVMTLPLASTADASISQKALGQIIPALEKADVLVLGCGMSQNSSTQTFIRSLISRARIPLVLDADGLNALAGHVSMLTKRPAPTVLTPHPKEMARLLKKDTGHILAARKNIAKDFSLRYNSTLILKGHRSLVCDGGRVYENLTGNPGLATAGSGDVLSGILAAFIGQGMPVYKAACLAVFIHGLAGDMAAKDKTQPGLVASDIIEYLPQAFKVVQRPPSARA